MAAASAEIVQPCCEIFLFIVVNFNNKPEKKENKIQHRKGAAIVWM